MVALELCGEAGAAEGVGDGVAGPAWAVFVGEGAPGAGAGLELGDDVVVDFDVVFDDEEVVVAVPSFGEFVPVVVVAVAGPDEFGAGGEGGDADGVEFGVEAGDAHEFRLAAVVSEASDLERIELVVKLKDLTELKLDHVRLGIPVPGAVPYLHADFHALTWSLQFLVGVGAAGAAFWG